MAEEMRSDRFCEPGTSTDIPQNPVHVVVSERFSVPRHKNEAVTLRFAGMVKISYRQLSL